VGFYIVYDVAGRWKQYTEGDPAFSFLNYSGTSEIDPSKEPKTIDNVVTIGNAQAEKAGQNEKGQIKRAVYEFVGNETLRVCFGAPGKERPTDLSKPDQGQLLWVLQRVKKEQPGPEDKKQPAPLHYYPDAKQRDLKKQLQDFETEIRKKWEKEPDATKAKLLQSGLEHYRERVKAMEEELKKLEKAWKEKGKEQGVLPQRLELKGSIFSSRGTEGELPPRLELKGSIFSPREQKEKAKEKQGAKEDLKQLEGPVREPKPGKRESACTR
jgi:uncharacterized protein (TIGR03067 family)